MKTCKGFWTLMILCVVVLTAPLPSFASDRAADGDSSSYRVAQGLTGYNRSSATGAGAADALPMAAIPGQPAATTGATADQGYMLGVGDRIRLTVYGEADLSGEYDVGSTGVVALPLVGDVPAAGQSIRAFEQAVRSKLAEGYLKDPRVSAQVVNYRPFFIMGEVSKPGSYPYVNGMTVLNAVALAGGYTYRADKSGVTITHANDASKKENPVPEESAVNPGDIIRVPERFF